MYSIIIGEWKEFRCAICPGDRCQNYLVKVSSYTRFVPFPRPGATYPYHFESASLPRNRLTSIDIKTTDIIRFYFNNSEHNLLHVSTNGFPVPQPNTLIDTRKDPDVIPSTETNRRGFAFDWKANYTTENKIDKYVVSCQKHLGEPDHELAINVASITDECLVDPPSDVDLSIYVGPFFFSGEGNPQTDPNAPLLNAIKGTTFTREGDKVRYIFNDNTHTAQQVGYNTLVDPGGLLAIPEFNFIPLANGDFFDWQAERYLSDEQTQYFVVCIPHLYGTQFISYCVTI